jgi:CAAX prenyl protease-like protein
MASVDQSANGSRAFLPWVVPFLLYVVPTAVEAGGWLGLSYETIYIAKAVATAAALWAFRRHYPPVSRTGFGLAVVAGVIGCALWVALAKLQAAIPGLQSLVDSLLGTRAAHDPFAGEGATAGRVAFVIVRLIGLAAIVPVMEEIFWRGFVARYLISDDFRSVPQGVFTRASFTIVTVAFAAVHPEILAALVWGALVNLLYRKTANLWACIVMHAVTNALLGAYILITGNWQLW